MATVTDPPILSRIDSLLEEINGTLPKAASELDLSGSARKDPGGYKGKSTHPSAKTDDHTHPAELGSRAKENESDVKEDHPGSGVDNTAASSGGSQDDKQYNIGTTQSATGEDPSVEDKYKGKKEDKRQGDRGGTSGPVSAEEIGEKYASMQLQPLVKLAVEKMNDLLADIANGNVGQIAVVAKTAGNDAAPSKEVGNAADLHRDAQAGYELAGLAGGLDKQAGLALIEQTIRDSLFDADLVGAYLQNYDREKAARSKRAAGDQDLTPPAGVGGGAMPGMGAMNGAPATMGMVPPEELDGAAGQGPGGGIDGAGPVTAPPGGPGGMPGGSEATDGPPAGMSPAGPGGPPGAAPGGPPGAPPEAGGGDGGGVSQEQAVEELANALMELKIPPEMLLAAAQHAAGGMADAKAAATDPVHKIAVSLGQQPAVTVAHLGKLASQVIDQRNAYKISIKRATGKQAAERAKIVAYLKEVCNL